MAGFLTSNNQTTGKPAAGPSLPPRILQLPSRAYASLAPPVPTTAAQATKKKKRNRNIACVSCHKQKKRCGDIRPCGRCIELGITCEQPIKPEGYTYFTRKRKLSRPPAVSSPPLSNGLHPLPGATTEKPQQDGYQIQHLPSPTPSVSTVGTPQTSNTSISSYDDPAQTTIPASTGKSGDVPEPNGLGSDMKPHSVSRGCTFLATPTEETPKTPIWDESFWDIPDLPASTEEILCEIAGDSKYTTPTVFGLEKSECGPNLQDGFMKVGKPMNFGDLSANKLDDLGMQGIEGAHGVDAGAAASGVASGAENGIAWDPDWLDEVDLSTTDLVLDDVDLLNLDFSCLNDDILMNSDMLQLFTQPVPPSSPPLSPLAPPPPPSPPPPLRSGAEAKKDTHVPH